MGISLLNGLYIGIVYGFFAAGIVLVYRVDRAINFAHGNIGMVGAFLFATLAFQDEWPVLLALGLGVLTSAAIGALTERLVARPLRGYRPEVLTLATFGVATLLFVFASRTWGTQAILNQPLVEGTSFELLGVKVQHMQVLTVSAALLMFGGLLLILKRTRFGLRVRAVALNPVAAEQVGVRTGLVSMAVWALAGAIAAISAILVSSRGPMNTSFMVGFMLRGLAAALVGGLTNLSGSFLAGIAIGVVQGFVGFQFTSPGTQEALLALFIILVLLARPTGLVRAEY